MNEVERVDKTDDMAEIKNRNEIILTAKESEVAATDERANCIYWA